MNKEDRETEEFFKGLAGHVAADSHSERGTTRIREALCAEIATLREAEQARTSDLSSEEKRAMDELKQRLLDQRLIGAAVSPHFAPATVREPRAYGNFWSRLLSDRWHSGFAVAAGLLLAVVIIAQTLLPQPDPWVVRGGEIPTLISEAPAGKAEALATSLRETGAEVFVIQINDHEWTLHIDVSADTDTEALRRWFETRGIRMTGQPPYRLQVMGEH